MSTALQLCPLLCKHMHLADEIYLKRILQKTKSVQAWRKHSDKQKMDEKKTIKKRKENIKAKPT